MKKIISLILSFIIFFPSYLISFIPQNIDKDFGFESGYSEEKIMLCDEYVPVEPSGEFKKSGKLIYDFGEAECDWFNYFGVKYKSDSYAKGIITYIINAEEYEEEFFLEPSESGSFYSFTDGIFDKYKSNRLCTLSFEPLNKETGSFALEGIGLFNREIPEREVFIQNDEYKLGVDLL